MFCFCFKDKTAAVLIAFLNLIVGVMGIFYFTPKIYYENNDLDSDYLCFSVVTLIAAGSLASALIWEKPTLVTVYQVLQISVMSIFVAHAIFFRTTLILYFQLLTPCLGKYIYQFEIGCHWT
ncbi:unnamed protein product [Acanthoscelides obtectus]|uniref:Uncharacterized protein n=1 Tax=Acanthoscelides obtectus TaxID=200917 RepID=A0A9P0L223_ACAOB|nr:unnamed protein product [Acanthoscelides obtectus]CAK1630429.1 hypothetical protein AOBTE_LOCUS6321 [Acanthoscelides obtectus]